MNGKMITAKIRSDGQVVEVLEGGRERPVPEAAMGKMTEAEIVAAAEADDR